MTENENIHDHDHPMHTRDTGPIRRERKGDPLGPEGIYGWGRCGRCGESFREASQQAEVAGTKDDPSASILDNLIIHVDCMTDADVLA